MKTPRASANGSAFPAVGLAVGAGLGLLVGTLAAGRQLLLAAVAAVGWLLYLSALEPVGTMLCVYAFLVPFDSVLGLGGGEGPSATLTRSVGLLLGAVLVVRLLQRRGRLARLQRPTGWAIAFCLLALSTVLWSVAPELSLSRVSTLLSLVGLYVLTSFSPLSSRDIQYSVFAAVAGGTAVSFFIVAQFVANRFSLISGVGRYTIFLGTSGAADPNGIAVALIAPLALAVGLAMSSHRKGALALLVVAAAMCMLAIGLTESRTGLLSMTAVMLVILWGARKAGATRAKTLALGVLFVVGALGLAAVGNGTLIARVLNAVQTGGAGRIGIWTNGLAAAKEYWIAGAGLNTFSLVYNRFAYTFSGAWMGVDRGAHNIYLGTVVEMGLPGLITLVGVLWTHGILMWRRLGSRQGSHGQWVQLALLATVVGLAVAGLTLDILWRKWFWWPLMLCLMFSRPESLPMDSTDAS
jgi:O-antigen ligase